MLLRQIGARRSGTCFVSGVMLVFITTLLAPGCGPQSEAGKPAADVKTASAKSDPSATVEPAGPPPNINIVIFLIDTLRADRLGAYGYTKHPNSPSMDALAAEGVVFEQANSPASWTLPSVASLMTSTLSCEHGVTSNQVIPTELPTLAERLQPLGYVTLGLYANNMVAGTYGFGRGFVDYRASTRNDPATIAPVLNKFVGSSGKPFFLYVHNLEPHNPYHFAPPHTPEFPDVGRAVRGEIEAAYKAYRKLTRVDFAAKQPLGTTDNTTEQDAAMAVLTKYEQEYSDLYDASVRLADSKVESTIAMLKQVGTWDRTLFILIADHGDEFNEHGGWTHDQSAYQELFHVPLIVKFPAGEHAGVRVKTPVSLIDVIPTIAEVLDRAEVGTPSRGHSLMPLVRAAATGAEEEASVRVVGMRNNGKKYYRPWKELRGDVNIIIRRGNWKGIWNVEVDTFELCDLDADPRETKNIATAHATFAGELREFAETWYHLCQEGALRSGEGVNVDDMSAEELENLRALGYVD